MATLEDLRQRFYSLVDDLKKNIEACWECVASESVRSYLDARYPSVQPDNPPLMAVVIQKMVDAIAAGIAFGRNPMKPVGNEIVIEAVKGLAEELVSGHCTPYRAVVNEKGTVKVIPPTALTPRVGRGQDRGVQFRRPRFRLQRPDRPGTGRRQAEDRDGQAAAGDSAARGGNRPRGRRELRHHGACRLHRRQLQHPDLYHQRR